MFVTQEFQKIKTAENKYYKLLMAKLLEDNIDFVHDIS
jgi:hypothetical protein